MMAMWCGGMMILLPSKWLSYRDTHMAEHDHSSQEKIVCLTFGLEEFEDHDTRRWQALLSFISNRASNIFLKESNLQIG